MDQVELVDFDQIRKDGIITMEKHMRMMNIILGVVFSVRPLSRPVNNTHCWGFIAVVIE